MVAGRDAELDALLRLMDGRFARLERARTGAVGDLALALLEAEAELRGARAPLEPAPGATIRELAAARAAVWYSLFRWLRSMDLPEYAEVAALHYKALLELMARARTGK